MNEKQTKILKNKIKQSRENKKDKAINIITKILQE